MPQIQTISRYHLFLKCPEGGRSEKVNYISMMMDMEEDFSERNPGELLAECIGDFLYDDLDHNVVTHIENNADDISCVNLVDKHNDDTCDVYDGVCIDTGCRFTRCGLRQYNAFFRSTDTKHTVLAPSPRRFSEMGKIWIPTNAISMQVRLCVISHCGRGGHRGHQVTLSAMKDHYLWNGMSRDIVFVVGSCFLCIVSPFN
jgi:Integrase zinc binding domain